MCDLFSYKRKTANDAKPRRETRRSRGAKRGKAEARNEAKPRRETRQSRGAKRGKAELSLREKLKPRLQLQRLMLVIREIRPRHRRIHITHITLILNISLRLTVDSGDTIFKY
jgi:hypothetical protein